MLSEHVLEQLRKDARRAILANPEAWRAAQARLLLEFMSSHGGDPLESTMGSLPTVEERLELLRSLGYRVMGQCEISTFNPKAPDEVDQRCDLSGGMWLNLSRPYVGSRRRKGAR